MAHIHTSHNDLEEKLQNAEQRREKRRWEYHLKERKRHNAMRPVYLILGIACMLVLCCLIWQNGIPRSVRLWFAEKLVDKTMDRLRNPWFFGDAKGLGIVLSLLLDLIWPLVCMLARILLPLLGWLVWLLMYILPLLIGILLLAAAQRKENLDAPLPEMTHDEEMHLRIDELLEGKHDDVGILRAGVEGERKALEYLASLTNDCHIYTNLRISHEGEESETDMVVVAPAGVTIVEVKNYNGTLLGDASDKHLVQIKDYDDTEDEKYNPIRQVATHAYRMAGYLRTNGVRTHVRTCVFFVNEDVTLKLTDTENVLANKCPVFKVQDAGSLRRYLQNSGSTLSDKDYRRILELLELLVR